MTTHRIVVVDVDRDGWTDGLQLSISRLDEQGAGDGYRLAGPKYNGSSSNLLRAELTEHDAAQIRSYLDGAFPQAAPDHAEVRAATLREAAAAVESGIPLLLNTAIGAEAKGTMTGTLEGLADRLRAMATEASPAPAVVPCGRSLATGQPCPDHQPTAAQGGAR
ncbi:hypothetical protein [Streptomyces sp. NPDC047315]|uniref:hypothetical protein n=1 Tax=Streptomyces sp. NPDC047315 TaxID=3155142 RepID=UPI0033D675E8